MQFRIFACATKPSGVTGAASDAYKAFPFAHTFRAVCHTYISLSLLTPQRYFLYLKSTTNKGRALLSTSVSCDSSAYQTDFLHKLLFHRESDVLLGIPEKRAVEAFCLYKQL